MNDCHSMLIQWSEADQLFLVTIPEFADLVMQPCTDGKTYAAALQRAQDCINPLLEFWQAAGVTPPLPTILEVV